MLTFHFVTVIKVFLVRDGVNPLNPQKRLKDKIRIWQFTTYRLSQYHAVAVEPLLRVSPIVLVLPFKMNAQARATTTPKEVG
ncbi:hypothetical protein, partial [Psychrobacter phenylpyruvicus]|uniref:hypothetical protein n=1 Tax=Psychrobacter phenylpyruvicus TaxID=29432 RepID=UPI0020D08E6E